MFLEVSNSIFLDRRFVNGRRGNISAGHSYIIYKSSTGKIDSQAGFIRRSLERFLNQQRNVLWGMKPAYNPYLTKPRNPVACGEVVDYFNTKEMLGMPKNLSPAILKRIVQFQRDEITGNIIYEYIADRQKDKKNKAVLLEIASAERNHYEIWKEYTGRDVSPHYVKIILFKIMSRVMGYTFTIKYMEQTEEFGIRELNAIEKEIPEARAIVDDEEEHEDSLMEMLDEERLHYVGALVLGLNDALVELTGTIAGLTFALASTRLVALSGIITGVSATLSMAASNYLAERANGNARALKSSVYTGVAYLITVILMVLPYLLLPNSLYIAAFGIMLSVVVLIILVFNYYISVAQGLPFLRRFGEMALISLGVAFISFIIGMIAKKLIGIDV